MVAFSASILAGRSNLPTLKLTRMNAAPIAVNISKKPTTSGMRNCSLAHGRRGWSGGRRLRGRWRVRRLDPDRFNLHLRRRDRTRIQRRLAPRHLDRQLSVIDDAAVSAEAALIVGRTHEDAIDRA